MTFLTHCLHMPIDTRLWLQKCPGIRLQLIEDHALILDCLERIKINLRNYGVAKPSLTSLYNTLFKYFGLQPVEMIEFLQQELDQPEDRKICEFLELNLREIKFVTVSFCQDHPADMSDIVPTNFIRDFAHFSESLHARVIAEQQYLIPYLERIINKYE